MLAAVSRSPRINPKAQPSNHHHRTAASAMPPQPSNSPRTAYRHAAAEGSRVRSVSVAGEDLNPNQLTICVDGTPVPGGTLYLDDRASTSLAAVRVHIQGRTSRSAPPAFSFTHRDGEIVAPPLEATTMVDEVAVEVTTTHHTFGHEIHRFELRLQTAAAGAGRANGRKLAVGAAGGDCKS